MLTHSTGFCFFTRWTKHNRPIGQMHSVVDRHLCFQKQFIKKKCFSLESNVSTLAFQKGKSSGITENVVERGWPVRTLLQEEKEEKGLSWWQGEKQGVEAFSSIIDPLHVAGDKKEGIKANSGLSSFVDQKESNILMETRNIKGRAHFWRKIVSSI